MKGYDRFNHRYDGGVFINAEFRASVVVYAAEHGSKLASQKFGVSGQSIRNWARAAGVKIANPWIEDSTKQKALPFLKQGYTVRQLTEKLGLHIRYARHLVDEHKKGLTKDATATH